MGCLMSKNNKHLINVIPTTPQIIKEYSSTDLHPNDIDVVNRRIWPELVGKNKDFVISFFQFNYPHLIIKFDEEKSNPYLSPDIYEFYDVLVKTQNGIVSYAPEF